MELQAAFEKAKNLFLELPIFNVFQLQIGAGLNYFLCKVEMI